ncbi:general secretion pathway protein G [Candidatus Moduliflexus flocculans]|uniref:General secretion pathway protein G n=1 Tax=Candidatus Moduliflexus flocculans TaxID=1499966 RepID=A0A081BNJ5_9BACT|nr:general secretion pathway protein G [Candidatus Moduliflexus flocculans]
MLRKEKGFTLIELLIVVAIIGIIAAIAVPNLLTAIQRSKQKRTMADLRAIGTALGSYQVDYNLYPSQASIGNFTNTTIGGSTAIAEQYYKGSYMDGWGVTYKYVSNGNNYTLCSTGKPNDTGGFGNDIGHVDGAMYEAGAFPTAGCQ